MSFNFEEYTKKYNVHPETIAVIKATPQDELNNVETKVGRFRTESGYLSGTVEFEGSEKEMIVPSPDVKGISLGDWVHFFKGDSLVKIDFPLMKRGL